MALEDIILEVEKEKEKRKRQIREEKEKELLEMKKIYEKEMEKKRKEILEKVKEDVEKSVLKKEEELKKEKKLLFLQTKWEIMEEICEKTFLKIKHLDRETEKRLYERWIENILKEIPHLSMEIVPSCGKEKLLSEVIEKKGDNLKLASHCVNSRGGFFIKTEKFDIDFTFETLFEKLKEESYEELYLRLNLS